MKICPKCNAQLPDEAAFCNQCGAKQETAPAAAAVPQEEKPVEEKPAEEKPVEEKPIEEKPVEEKPIEEKPIEEKPVENVPAEENAFEEKPAEEKTEDQAPAGFIPGSSTVNALASGTVNNGTNSGGFVRDNSAPASDFYTHSADTSAAGGFTQNTAGSAAGGFTQNTAGSATGGFTQNTAGSATSGFAQNAGAAPMNGFAAASPEGAAIAADNAAEAAKKKKLMQLLIICGAAAAALVVIIVIAVLLSAGGYKKPIKNLVKLANKESTDVGAYLECVTPSFTASAYKELTGLIKGGDAKKELDYAIKDGFEDIFDEFEDDYGKNWKVSVEYKNSKKMKDKDLSNLEDSYQSLASLLKLAELDDEDKWEELSDELDDEYDSEINASKAAKAMEKFIDNLDDIEFTSGYEVKLKVTISGKDDKDSETVTVNVVKNKGGKWFIDPTGLASEMGVNPYSLMNSMDFDF